MAEAGIISQGATLMLYGMGVVFVFLTFLVFATTLMSRLVQQFTPQVAGEQSDTGLDPRHVAAITAAIHLHRQGFTGQPPTTNDK